MPQVGRHCCGPRPVLYRRGHPGRRLRLGELPAAGAHALDHLVLGDGRLHLGDLGDLPTFHPRLLRTGQPVPAPAARGGLVPHHMIRAGRQLHRSARLPLRPTRPAGALLPQRLRRRLRQPVARRRLAGVLRVLLHPRHQVRDLRGQLPDQHPLLFQLPAQHRDLGVPLGQQLPQPRVRDPQARDHLIRRRCLTGHRGRTGHIRYSGKTGPR